MFRRRVGDVGTDLRREFPAMRFGFRAKQGRGHVLGGEIGAHQQRVKPNLQEDKQVQACLKEIVCRIQHGVDDLAPGKRAWKANQVPFVRFTRWDHVPPLLHDVVSKVQGDNHEIKRVLVEERTRSHIVLRRIPPVDACVPHRDRTVEPSSQPNLE